MTCKDCVHYDVCKRDIAICVCRISKKVEMLCDYFKDKTRFVELPCKVGDTVYRIIHLNDKYLQNTNKLKIADWWQIVEIGIYQDDICFIDDSDNEFTIDDIGKTVFLTREEAEEKLKENRYND